MRVNEKFFLYLAVLLVSASPAVVVGGSVVLTVESWCVVSPPPTLDPPLYCVYYILQLAFVEPWSSIVSAACGVVVALLYWSKHSPLQRFRVPGRRLFAVRLLRCITCLC